MSRLLHLSYKRDGASSGHETACQSIVKLILTMKNWELRIKIATIQKHFMDFIIFLSYSLSFKAEHVHFNHINWFKSRGEVQKQNCKYV